MIKNLNPEYLTRVIIYKRNKPDFAIEFEHYETDDIYGFILRKLCRELFILNEITIETSNVNDENDNLDPNNNILDKAVFTLFAPSSDKNFKLKFYFFKEKSLNRYNNQIAVIYNSLYYAFD